MWYIIQVDTSSSMMVDDVVVVELMMMVVYIDSWTGVVNKVPSVWDSSARLWPSRRSANLLILDVLEKLRDSRHKGLGLPEITELDFHVVKRD